MEQLSVLMSLYIKEKPEYVKVCFDSLLKQSVQADEWVIVEDGPLTSEMYELLEIYEKNHPGLIKRISLSTNQGLGVSLKIGISECRNELVARMDTDDIARKDRFERQLAEFKKNPGLDICGSNIDEFEDDPSIIVARRNVPEYDEEIKQYQKRRDAFNHMTVMYKKEAVLRAGNYESCPLMEDTYLWVRMIQAGANCMNINEPLVYARIGRDMFERRGGWSYFIKYLHGRKMVYQTGYISRLDYYSTVFAQLIVALMPSSIRGKVFKRILHK